MSLAASWISWAPLGAASLHIVEEFFYPGGFAAWDREYRPGIRKSITTRFHVIMNGLLLVACYDVAALAKSPLGIPAWLTVTALLFSNAIWHLIGAVKTRKYSPGMVTGSLLYIPLAVYGYAHLLRTGRSSVSTAAVAFAIGISYHLWVARAVHAWRSRRVRA